MIKISPKDSIVDIIEKIESQKKGDVFLHFPLGHPILHSYISLKILKSKTGERKLIIASSDKIGKRIGKQLGIEYSHIKDSGFIQDQAKYSLLKHNFSIWEYIKYQGKQYKQELKNFLHTNKQVNTLSRYSNLGKEKSYLHIFLGALLASIFIFAFIYYFVVNKTYIEVRPEMILKTEALNFIFRENNTNSILGNNRNINLELFSHNIQLTEKYASTGIEVIEAHMARGTIRIFNTLTEAQTLVPNTRFQTEEGIVFTLSDWVEIPAGVVDNLGENRPGTIDVEVQAQIRDSQGRISGSRANIKKETHLILPGLPESLQSEIYAQSLDDFSGGKNEFETFITQEDQNNARALLEEKLKQEALIHLKQEVYNYNDANGSKLELFPGNQSIIFENINIDILAGGEVGTKKENFTLSGSLTIQGYAFNTLPVLQELKNRFNEKMLSGIEQISHIDESTLRMSELIYYQENPLEIKASFEMQGIFFHDFLHQSNSYLSLLKSKIRGLPKEEAERILINDPKISWVRIRIRPFFIDTISNIQNNIIFRIKN